MAERRSIEFKLGTCNVMSLPRQKSIHKVLQSTLGLHLKGLQECDPDDYKRAVFRRWTGVNGIGSPTRPANNTYSCPLVFSRNMFTASHVHSHKVYDGHEGISLTRHLTNGVMTHRGARVQFGAVNIHSVVGHGAHRAQRLAMKAEAKAVLFSVVKAYLAAGLPVAVMGDFNDTVNWFGKSFHGHKVTRIGHGIDQVLLIDTDTHKWDVLAVSTRETPSDHDTLRARVTLSW